MLGAIGAFIIDKKFVEASAFAAAGAVLTFFGFMHGESVGIAVTPSVAVAYAMVAAFLFALSRAPAVAAAEASGHAPGSGGDAGRVAGVDVGLRDARRRPACVTRGRRRLRDAGLPRT